jgi:hypothetical protein
MAVQQMGPVRGWEERLHRCPYGTDHLALTCAHDDSDLHQDVGLRRAQNRIRVTAATGDPSPIRAASESQVRVAR